jgi:hypothetical protein
MSPEFLWLVENQGFRELTQRWRINTLASRKFAANTARVAFVLMLYNTERCLRWKCQERWQAEKRRLADWGETGLMGGQSVVVYTPSGQLGLYSVPQYRDIIQRAGRRAVVQVIRAGLERGRTVCDLLQELDT